ncbi:P-loop containing nucleoside triphosphate hydrolase [Fusarium albosuccineum]|uniref:P-loop containing nucleoside triphosphate hydrolase n=1 Tax=Fusarium albosuccineum TaxID=1237068 RepID=A0A8H4PHD8_9HYPO|nr:P-loop containing nucleoside triphosphate hydrolase [Fusarium albosuccineum]
MVIEALEAVSLCGSVIQFVEFSIKSFKQVRIILTTGELDQDAQASSHAKALVELTDHVVGSCDGFLLKIAQDLKAGSEADQVNESLATTERQLQDVVEECQAMAEKLRDKLTSFKAPPTKKGDKITTRTRKKWTAFYRALFRIWNESKIEEMMKQMEKSRNVVQTTILANISAKIDLVVVQQSQKFMSLTEGNKMIVTSLLQSQNEYRALKSEVAALSVLLSRSQMVITTEQRRTQKLIADAYDPNPSSATKQHAAITSYSVEERNLRKSIAEELVKSLRFNTIKSRFEAVEEAHDDTFHWIYEDPRAGYNKDSGRIWGDFSAWLRNDNGIYWITGKPASGKSTLMKYIVSNSKTERLLNEWAETHFRENRLCMAKFFFWISGNKDQRSQIGLLRGILFDVLTKFPWLVATAFPEEWSTRYCHELQPPEGEEDEYEDWDWRNLIYSTHTWSLESLKEAILRLGSQKQYPLQVCLFVDGLDEYDGDETDIARFFSQISESPNIKCCVSSRPHQPFIDAFKSSPTIQIHDFTKPDIEKFVETKLNADDRWKPLALESPEQAAQLRRDIVESAKGVFLWVKLVVHSLLRGLGNHDGVRDLQARLLEIPKELEGLYNRMITVEDVYKLDRSRIFRLVHTAADLKGPLAELTLLEMAIAMDAELDIALTAAPDFLTQEEINRKSSDIAFKVVTRCGGLLEVQRQVSMEESSPGLEVSYLHRTVKEYLQTQNQQNALQRRGTGSNGLFNPLYAIFVAYIISLNLELNNNVRISPEHPAEDSIRTAMRCLYRFQFDDTISQERYNLLCNRTFDLVNRLSWENEGVKRVFPPRRPRQLLAIEFRPHRYLDHLMKQPEPQKAIHTWLEVAVASLDLDDPGENRDETIRVLLGHGANINAAWTRWLKFHSIQEIGSGQSPAGWKAKVKLFLLHGAVIDQKQLDTLAGRLPEEMRVEILEDPYIQAHIRPNITAPGALLPPLDLQASVENGNTAELAESFLGSDTCSAGGSGLGRGRVDSRTRRFKDRAKHLFKWKDSPRIS